jgi:hypothetical protein
MTIPLQTLADIQQDLLAPVQWALNATFHTVLQATPAQLAFCRDMIMPTSYMAHWQSLCQHRQAITDKDNARENLTRIPHTYSNGDMVLLKQDVKGKLAKLTCGPYRIIDVSRQNVNGTVVLDLGHSNESFNIRRLIPFNRPTPPLRTRMT